MEYDFKKIEQKWQKVWEDEKRFEVQNHKEGKENMYVLIEFPYPSGVGLHMGHCRSYTAIDAFARKKRLQGYNVMFPFGTDAYGLEAERTAIKEHKPPQEIVARNIKTFQQQVRSIGLGIDWSRTINTCDADYYKWTQWQFIQFFKHGLAEKREMSVNYCPNCGVLANEEVEDGVCCQCHSETTQKLKSQWVLKMTEYGDRLDEDLKDTNFMEHIKTSQKNWIGKSEGVEVDFEIVGGGKLSIFTTCIETIYGITFMVVAPESNIVDELKPRIKNWEEVEAYRKATAKKTEFDRSEMNKDKSGVKLEGIFAINPVNNKKIPVYIGDFVIASYGTGAVMAVPTHDQRDFEFAKKYNIDMIQVIDGADVSEKAFEKYDYLGKGCKLINSEEFSGLTVEQAKVAIVEKLEKLGVGRRKLNFKMRDWIFSRQRYWGEPIPMVYCKHCGWVPEKDENLPVELPKVESYEPTKDGESPLSLITDWVNTVCPNCGEPAKRETDTMPGWAGSSWYFLRYCDPKNDKEFANYDALKAWLPVELYNGGNEHTTRHLLYARFWNKFLYDCGLSPVSEPFKCRISQGLILGSDGKKMSKSSGNGVDPLVIVNQYGADAVRLWMSFIGDYFESVSWSEDGVKACKKFINKIVNFQEILTEGEEISAELKVAIHSAIKKVSNDIDNFKFNTAISALMILANEITRVGKLNNAEYKVLLTLLNPFAPHITEEIWTNLNYSPSIKDASWPKFDEKALIKQELEVPIQVNGKLRAKIMVNINSTKEEIEAQALSAVKGYLNNGEYKKIIYIPNKIFNIVV